MNTKLTASELSADFDLIRAQGYGTENEENETGVACLAIPIFLGSMTKPSGAVSVSALIYRTPLQKLVDDVRSMMAIVQGGSTTAPR